VPQVTVQLVAEQVQVYVEVEPRDTLDAPLIVQVTGGLICPSAFEAKIANTVINISLMEILFRKIFM
jgi:hypothetical protein